MALRHLTAIAFISIVMVVLPGSSLAWACFLELSSPVVDQGVAAWFATDCGDGGSSPIVSFRGGEVVMAETGGDVSRGLVAVDLEADPGDYLLVVASRRGAARRTVTVREGDFRVERLTLPPEKVTLSEEDLARVRRESEELSAVWKSSGPAPLWDGEFVMPVEGRVSGTFGDRRILNGEPRSPHGGLDIAAPRGTAVEASNSGRVAFTGEFFFVGRFVVVDHGAGVFTLYAHLSEVAVARDETVGRGSVIGRVGSTGRSSGPHLHFSVRVNGARVSPPTLFAAAAGLAAPVEAEKAGDRLADR